MERIENINPLTRQQKLVLRMKNFFKMKAIAYGTSAVVGAAAGTATQEVERTITGYDPVAHKALKAEIEKPKEVDDFGKYRQEKAEGKKRGILEWSKDMFSKMKRGVLNPSEFIQSLDMYKTIQLKYLDTLKFIDDVAFYAPALLMLIMLGGYLNRTLMRMQGNVVDQAEKKMIFDGLNKLIDAANEMSAKIEALGVDQLSPEELAEARQALEAFRVLLPNDDEID